MLRNNCTWKRSPLVADKEKSGIEINSTKDKEYSVLTMPKVEAPRSPPLAQGLGVFNIFKGKHMTAVSLLRKCALGKGCEVCCFGSFRGSTGIISGEFINKGLFKHQYFGRVSRNSETYT